MPIYEYKCGACGEEHDILQKMSADPLTTCPKCGEEGLERLVSASSFALKGGGWYADGYGAGSDSSSDKESKTSDSAPAKNDSKPSSTPTESKPSSSDSKSSD